MAASVQVLCPNGRRETVKVSPNTKIIQIIEDVCLRQGFKAHEYGLRHGRTILDVSAAFRFTGLPNNAKLELVQTEDRCQSAVTVALLLESGERKQRVCMPDASLWDILVAFEDESSDEKLELTRTRTTLEGVTLYPVCIYMQEEIIGQTALEATTLASLGLLAGKAVVRHIYRHVGQQQLGEIAAKIQLAQAKRRRLASKQNFPEVSAVNPNAASSIVAASTECVADPVVSSTAAVNLLGQESSATMTSGAPPQVDTADPADHTGSLLRTGCTADRDVAAGSNLHQQQQHPVAAEAELSHLSLEETAYVDDHSRVISEAVGNPATAACEAVLIFSAENSTPPDASQQRPAEAVPPDGTGLDIVDVPGGAVSEQLLATDYSLLTSMATCGAGGLPTAVQGVAATIFTGPEAQQGIKHSEEINSSHTESAECSQPWIKREMIAYGAGELSGGAYVPDEELPDDFFEVTARDAEIMLMDRKREIKQMEEMPLQTQAQRDAIRAKKVAKYKKAVIRFRFPDGIVVQAKFKPEETVLDMRHLVMSLLMDKTANFYLYTTPPRSVLDVDSKTLVQACLVPTSFVYVGATDATAGLKLLPSVLANMSDRRLADASANASIPPAEPADVVQPSFVISPVQMVADAPAAAVEAEEGTERRPMAMVEKKTIPKWYKPGTK